MSPPSDGTTAPGVGPGRVNQRNRTRQAILEAASTLLEDGGTPTVAEAADAALVSRATAYRYFPSQDDLLTECAHYIGWPKIPELMLDGEGAPVEAEERVVLLHDFFYDYIRNRETLFRHYLRRQLLSGLPDGSQDRLPRPAYRVGLIERALSPIVDELGADRSQRLAHALGVLIGTEAVIASRDVLCLDDDTARADNGWACRQLVRAARAEAAATPAAPAKRARTKRALRS
jgi:AcrR family transcriptional regulator